jgi:hypothetical protein
MHVISRKIGSRASPLAGVFICRRETASFHQSIDTGRIIEVNKLFDFFCAYYGSRKSNVLHSGSINQIFHQH